MKNKFTWIILLGTTSLAWGQKAPFAVEEASIKDIQDAIRSGRTSCRAVVESYFERAKAYNGSCTALITPDGAPLPPATGMVRAGKPLQYPTQTVKASTFFPDLDQYVGPPLEFGRMDSSVSDPNLMLQFGMRAGIADAGQVNALETLNIRGERSYTCRGDFDKHPAFGPLPAGAPPECEQFRKQPDALERAAELDLKYGKNPDLAKLPMYCVVFSLKNWYDAKDMRATGGNDVKFAMDAPRKDSPDVAELRAKGAIIYAIATANAVGGPTAPGGTRANPTKASKVMPDNNLQYGLWGGNPCNPYDTTRVPRGTSGGSGVSVAANLATCSICEQGFASCKGPASRNNVVNLLTTKGIIMDGGIGSKTAGDRAGIHCKSVPDAATVLDAIKGFESDDMFTAIPKGLIPQEPYTSFLVKSAAVPGKPLKGVRVALAREFMVKHTKNDETISDQIDKEVKAILRDKLGAELVETVDPMYPDDPDVPNIKYTFEDAFAEILPHNVPEYFYQKLPNGKLEFAVPGWDVQSVDYMVALSLHQAPLSPGINLRRVSAKLSNPRSQATLNKYLHQRGDATIKDWSAWVENAKFKTEADTISARNASKVQDPRADTQTMDYIKMQATMRMVVLKVMKENKIDVFVNPEQTTAPYLLGGAPEPEVNNRPSLSCCGALTALMGSPEIEVPAGYTTVAYDPQYELSADKKSYVPVTGKVKTQMPHPMPISLMVWSGPGSDSDVIKVASAYESATKHRVPPPAFGPLKPAPISSAKK